MLNKIEIKVGFTDFWAGFDSKNNFFYNLLIEKYHVIISDDPDFLFYSVYSTNHSHYRCIKILYTGENQRPNFWDCDFAFSFDHIPDKRNYRLPLYALWADVNHLLNRKKDMRKVFDEKKNFCCFVVSNDKCEIRNAFFTELSKYKHIDSGGSVFNNIGGLVDNKRNFIRDYKFVISFENSSYPGYTTEKVYESLVEDCVPIYWGNPLIAKDFNTKSMVNCHNYSSFSEVIEHIKVLDNDKELYLKYLSEPAFTNDKLNEYVKKENIVKRLDEIVAFQLKNKFKFIQITRPIPIYFRSVKNYFNEITLRKIIRSSLSFVKSTLMKLKK